MDLRGATAIVTGSSRGIGKAIALELARRGCNVVVAARTVRTTPQRRGTVQETAQEVEALGVRALAVPTDVTSMLDVRHMVEETLRAFGRIDVLVNNAGEIGDDRNFLDVTPEQWNAILGSNLFGAFHCALSVAPVMVGQGVGRYHQPDLGRGCADRLPQRPLRRGQGGRGPSDQRHRR